LFNEDPLGADADPTTPAPPPEVDESVPTVHEQTVQNSLERSAEADLDLSEFKKKKKPKKEMPLDVDESIPAAVSAGADGGDLDFSDLKKKKKKSSKKNFDLEEFERQLGDSSSKPSSSSKEKEDDGEDADPIPGVDDEVDLGEDPFARVGEEEPISAPTGEAWLGSDRDYTYNELLSRFFRALHTANPALASSTGKRYTLAPPSIHREGNKKTIFANVTDICRRMHRQPEHVIQFLFAEMGTTGSVDGAGRLVIRGRFLQKQVENILRRYIVEYVTCKTCKSPDTLLTKENRIYFMACESCGSRMSVSAIKTGFQAQVGRRSKTAT
jgi:translation initiation factor 2 subunit 2